MIDPMAPASSRVRAAVSILEIGQKAMELEDIEVRIKRLGEVSGVSGPERFTQARQGSTKLNAAVALEICGVLNPSQ